MNLKILLQTLRPFCFFILLLCSSGCDREAGREVQTIHLGPNALLHEISSSDNSRLVDTNGMIYEGGAFTGQDWQEILKLVKRIPRINLKVQRVVFFGEPHPVAAQVQVPHYMIYFVKPLEDKWKGAAVVFSSH